MAHFLSLSHSVLRVRAGPERIPAISVGSQVHTVVVPGLDGLRPICVLGLPKVDAGDLVMPFLIAHILFALLRRVPLRSYVLP